MEDGRKELETILEIDPGFGKEYLARYTFTDEQREMFESSLRTAGLDD